MSDHIRFLCPTCKSVMTAPVKRAGNKINCLKCCQRLQIPTAERAKTILAPSLGLHVEGTPAPPAQDSSAWYYTRNGSQFGPFNTEELKELVASGHLSTTDLLWKDGMVNWVPASTVNGLFAPPAENVPPQVPAATLSPAASAVPVSVSSPPKSSPGRLWTRAKIVGLSAGGVFVVLLSLAVFLLGRSGGNELQQFQGVWKLEAIVIDRKRRKEAVDLECIVDGNTMFQAAGQVVLEYTFQIDPERKPKSIDLTDLKGHIHPGIYSLEGDSLRICMSTSNRPTDFSQPGTILMELKRVRNVGLGEVAVLREKIKAQVIAGMAVLEPGMAVLEQAKVDAAVAGIRTIETAVTVWNARNGEWPPNLDILTQPNLAEQIAAPLREKDLLDPWKQRYQYFPDQLHPATQRPLIRSLGAGKNEATAITNWEKL